MERFDGKKPNTEEWLCPHCYRRCLPSRVLVGVGERISLCEDRRRYWHVKRSVGIREVPDVQRLNDVRLLSLEMFTKWRNGRGANSDGHCPHCHMPLFGPLKGTVVGTVLSNDTGAVKSAIEKMQQIALEEKDMDRENSLFDVWYEFPQRLTYDLATRRENGWQRIAFLLPDGAPEDETYWEELKERLYKESSGYVLLLQLDHDEDESACWLVESLWHLHGAQEDVRRKAAGVVCIAPQGEREIDWDAHRRLQFLLDFLFQKKCVLETNTEALQTVFPHAFDVLAQLENLCVSESENKEEQISTDTKER